MMSQMHVNPIQHTNLKSLRNSHLRIVEVAVK